jgi:protein involved in polysaccharide export with SLBB domain
LKINPQKMMFNFYRALMRLKSAVVFLFVFAVVVKAQAQPPADPNGGVVPPINLSPSDLYKGLQDKNPDALKSTIGSDKNKSLANKITRDSLVREATPQSANITETTYGMQLFSNGVVAEVTDLSTPPLDYPIGVYDMLIVSLWNGAEATLDYTVARDGSIFPAGLGKIYVQGLTFEQVRSLIIQRFKSYVPASTNITVSLGQPRTVNINVAGEINKQGPVTVSAFTNAFNVIALAGGPTDLADLRSILIKRNGRVIDELDVYKYLTTGDFGKHIYLENNDFVILQTVKKRVKAEGKFKRPMFYQLKPNEGMKALLRYSGGLLNDAFSSGVKVYRTQLEQQIIKDVNATAIINPTNDSRLAGQDFSLEDGDIVKVIAINPGLFNKVEVKGEVSYPGQYEIRKGDRLFDVINRAGGITRNTYLQRAYVFRGGGDSTKINSNRLEVDLTDITKIENELSRNNVEIYANDQVLLFNSNSFSDRQYVEIFGEVRKEGKVNKYGGMTLQDLLYLSGGLKQSAEYGRIEISSVVDIDSAKNEQQPTRVIVKQIRISSNMDIDSTSSKIVLKPYDQIYVRKNPTFELQQLVTLNGLIKYPGPYPRLDKNERLTSYIERAGGITELADLTGAILYRKKTQYFRDNIAKKAAALSDSLGTVDLDSAQASLGEVLQEPVSIDLYKALKYKGSKYDVVLQEGDVIFIPEINPFVSVKGAVQSPLKLAFDKEHTNLSYYIDKAGGYGIRPWRNRIYVQYANGKSKRTKTLFFMHFYPKVAEGSVVNVPVKPNGSQVGDIVKQAGLSLITSLSAIMVATVVAKIIN